MRKSLLTYSEFSRIESYEDRFEYLKLGGGVGRETFGSERYLNQEFYRSAEWRRIRNIVIARDMGRDLGVEGFEIHGQSIHIHHMNPMTVAQVMHSEDVILDPEYLISVTHRTHNAIHYGTISTLPSGPAERRPGDTTLWRS